MNFKRTLDDPIWLAKNGDAIRSIFPTLWTCPCTISENHEFLAGKLKPIGIKLRSHEDMSQFTFRLLQLGVLEFRNGKRSASGFFRVKPVVDTGISITA